MAKKPVNAELPDAVEDDIALEGNGAEDKKEKKEKKKKEKKEKKQKKKGGFPVVPVLILLVIIGAIAGVVVFNLFNIREQYIMPYLRNAPLIGQYFAEPETPEDSPANRYATMTPEEILAEVTALEAQVTRLETELQDAQNQKTADDETIAYLRGFESQIENYRDVKARFDEMVVTGANPEDYIAYFESVSPENAERLAEMALTEANYNDETAKLSATYAAMDAQAAADALVLMLTNTRTDQLVSILKNMSSEDQANIFDNIPAEQMSQITNLLFPETPAELPAATAPPLANE